MEAKLKRIPTGRPDLISFELPADYKQEYAYLVKKAETTNDYWRVSLEPWRNKRSTGDHSQGNHFNGHVQQIADSTGNDFADVKLFCKRSAMREGLPAKKRPDGSIVYSMTDGEPIPISEADMTTQECSWCIEACHLIAAELDITLREGYD
jgi:hypothetical protein